MRKAYWLMMLSALLLAPRPGMAQTRPADTAEVYRVRPLLSAGASLAGIVLIRVGRERNLDKKMISQERLNGLREEKVNVFDRIALRQDVTKNEQIAERSNTILLATTALPVLLFLDEDIRQDFLDVSLMYLESQVATTFFHTWGPLGPTFISRIRPASYYEELELKNRMGGNQRNAFYSGHVASAATATFFVAKVLDDYHPEWRGEKWLLYGAALVPPAIVGVMRVQSLRHWPTDVVAGLAIGAATGFLIPELHRIKDGQLKVSLHYGQAVKGLALQLNF